LPRPLNYLRRVGRIGQALFLVGLMLVLVGFTLALVAAVLMALRVAREGGKAKGGGVVVIGPFPVVFGTDRESVKVLLILSIALTALLLVAYALSARVFG